MVWLNISYIGLTIKRSKNYSFNYGESYSVLMKENISVKSELLIITKIIYMISKIIIYTYWHTKIYLWFGLMDPKFFVKKV